MNWIGAVEGGLTGTAALKVIQETLHKIDGSAPRPFLRAPVAGKKAKRKEGKGVVTKRHLQQAGELLGSVLYFGAPALGDKDKAPLLGGAMGAAAGLWVVFGKKQKGDRKQKKKISRKVYNLFLYTAAGILAGEAIKHFSPAAKKQDARKNNQEEKKLDTPFQKLETKTLSTILYIEGEPVGYQIQKEEGRLCFDPSQHSAKECCPPRFKVVPDGTSWLFEPATLTSELQNQVIQELQTLEAGKLLD
jgi:hypothetical protein